MALNILEVFEYNQHFVAMMNIINSARLRNSKVGHKHHIIPRCWFKMMKLPVDNSKSNLVMLTPEEHAKVHVLAYLCSNGQIKRSLACAATLMNKSNNSVNKKDIQRIPWNKGKKGSQVSWCKGKKLSEEHKLHVKEHHAHNHKSIFTCKFVSHFNINPCDDPKLYTKEYTFYLRHNKVCRWELSDYKPYNTGKRWKEIDGKRIWFNKE